MKSYVCGFYFKVDVVLLIEKKRPAWQRGRCNGIGGKIEPGEAPVLAMVREFSEEAGVYIEADRWHLVARLEGIESRVDGLNGEPFEVWFFRAEARDTDEETEAQTDEQLVWFEGNSSRSFLPNLTWLIPMARIGMANDWPFQIRERAHAVDNMALEGQQRRGAVEADGT